MFRYTVLILLILCFISSAVAPYPPGQTCLHVLKYLDQNDAILLFRTNDFQITIHKYTFLLHLILKKIFFQFLKDMAMDMVTDMVILMAIHMEYVVVLWEQACHL